MNFSLCRRPKLDIQVPCPNEFVQAGIPDEITDFFPAKNKALFAESLLLTL
jgi:hypothetical protein